MIQQVSSLQVVLIADVLQYDAVYLTCGEHAKLTEDHNLMGYVDINADKRLVIMYPRPNLLDETRFKTFLPVAYARAKWGNITYQSIVAILGSWYTYFPEEN